MTHFTVLVLHRPDQVVAALLAQYDEHIEVAPYITATAAEVQQEIAEKVRPFHARHGHDIADWPDARLWKDWKSQDLDAGGNAVSTANPRAKWDWWLVGGRYPGTLILRPGAAGTAGELSWMFRPDRRDPDEPDDYYDGGRRADSARLADIDWAAMDAAAREAAAAEWDEAQEMIADADDPARRDALRAYWCGDVATKEDYVAAARYAPDAVVDSQGDWHAPPEIGYGDGPLSDREVTARNRWARRAFAAAFHDTFVTDADPPLVATVVDCHI